MAGRGRPHIIVSDNVTNFVDAARESQETANGWNQTLIQQSLAQQNFVRKFNLPEPQHLRGVRET